jgi:hypothetical protein
MIPLDIVDAVSVLVLKPHPVLGPILEHGPGFIPGLFRNLGLLLLLGQTQSRSHNEEQPGEGERFFSAHLEPPFIMMSRPLLKQALCQSLSILFSIACEIHPGWIIDNFVAGPTILSFLRSSSESLFQ